METNLKMHVRHCSQYEVWTWRNNSAASVTAAAAAGKLFSTRVRSNNLSCCAFSRPDSMCLTFKLWWHFCHSALNLSHSPPEVFLSRLGMGIQVSNGQEGKNRFAFFHSEVQQMDVAYRGLQLDLCWKSHALISRQSVVAGSFQGLRGRMLRGWHEPTALWSVSGSFHTQSAFHQKWNEPKGTGKTRRCFIKWMLIISRDSEITQMLLKLQPPCKKNENILDCENILDWKQG